MPRALSYTPPPTKDVLEVLHLLRTMYPSVETELDYENPFQLLIAVILSAQCTDARVNLVTPELFRRYPDAKALAGASSTDIERLIHSCGFYRAKTKAIQSTSKDIVEKFNNEIPGTLEELVTLKGVGRKTASVVLNQAFDVPAIAVDTHVIRVSNRLGWSNQSDPVKIEFQLREAVPEKHWADINMLLIWHGRRTCKARKPLCEQCRVRDYCKYYWEVAVKEKGRPSQKKKALAPSKGTRKGTRASKKNDS